MFPSPSLGPPWLSLSSSPPPFCGIPELAPPEAAVEVEVGVEVEVELCVVVVAVLVLAPAAVELELLLPPPQPATTSASAPTAKTIETTVRNRLIRVFI
jgi:hypothetical protein